MESVIPVRAAKCIGAVQKCSGMTSGWGYAERQGWSVRSSGSSAQGMKAVGGTSMNFHASMRARRAGRCLVVSIMIALLVGNWPGTAEAATSKKVGIDAATPSLAAAIARSMDKDAVKDPVYRIHRDGCSTIGKPGLRGCFGEGLVEMRAGAATMRMQLRSWGWSGQERKVRLKRDAPHGNRVEYRAPGLVEWWRSLPIGFEQGFTLQHVPTGAARKDGNIVLNLTASEAPEIAGDALVWGRLHYGKLLVTDAGGNTIPSTLSSHGRDIRIVLHASHARWPITVDPLLWEEQDIQAADGSAGDQFGKSIVMHGNSAFVGAPDKTVNGHAYQGAVYVFDGHSGVWQLSTVLSASDGSNNQNFGWSIAASGSHVIIGARGDSNGLGAAYVFTYLAGSWQQTGKLKAGDPNTLGNAEYFGSAVDVLETTSNLYAVVGAPYKDVNGHTFQGAAYVFSYDNLSSTWSQVKELTAADGGAADRFGTSVSIDPDNSSIVVGAVGQAKGAAYVYDYLSGVWTAGAELHSPDSSNYDLFGASVAMRQNVIAIGMPEENVGGVEQPGAVFFYTGTFSPTGSTWTQQAKISAPDGAASDGFGQNLAFDGTTANDIIIGASPDNNGSPEARAYIYHSNTGATWTQTDELIPAHQGPYSAGLVTGVSLATDYVLVGVPIEPVGSNDKQGQVYSYYRENLSAALSSPSAVVEGQQFDSTFTVTNNSGAVSFPLKFVFHLPAGAATYVSASPGSGSSGCTYNSSDVTVSCTMDGINGVGSTASATVTMVANSRTGPDFNYFAVVDNTTPQLQSNATVSTFAPLTLSGLTDVSSDQDKSANESFTIDGTGPFVVQATSSNTVLLPNAGISGLSSCTAPGTCSLKLTPASGQSGSTTVTVTVTDDAGQKASGSFVYTVKPASSGSSGGSSSGGGGGGGGSFGPWMLCALLALAWIEAAKRRQAESG
jgi:hypothetical protein